MSLDAQFREQAGANGQGTKYVGPRRRNHAAVNRNEGKRHTRGAEVQARTLCSTRPFTVNRGGFLARSRSLSMFVSHVSRLLHPRTSLALLLSSSCSPSLRSFRLRTSLLTSLTTAFGLCNGFHGPRLRGGLMSLAYPSCGPPPLPPGLCRASSPTCIARRTSRFFVPSLCSASLPPS